MRALPADDVPSLELIRPSVDGVLEESGFAPGSPASIRLRIRYSRRNVARTARVPSTYMEKIISWVPTDPPLVTDSFSLDGVLLVFCRLLVFVDFGIFWLCSRVQSELVTAVTVVRTRSSWTCVEPGQMHHLANYICIVGAQHHNRRSFLGSRSLISQFMRPRK